MAVKLIEARVCDFDDQVATQTITFRGPDGKNHVLDVCDGTMRELMRKSHTPRRGRKPGSKTAAKRKKAAARKPAAKRKGAKKKSAAKKR
jgi:hypothetical protein